MRRARFVLRALAKRALHDRLVLAATAISTLCALVLVAAGPIYADGIGSATLRRQLTDLDPATASVAVTVRSPAAWLDSVDALVDPWLDRLVEDTGGETIFYAQSDSLAMPNADDRLAVLRWMPELRDRVTIATGTWPELGSDRSQVALGEAAAAAARVAVGDVLELSPTRSDGIVTVEVVGLFVPDPDDPLVATDPLLATGVGDGVRFQTVGPFIVADPAVGSGANGFVELSWWTAPDLRRIDESSARTLRQRTASLEADVTEALNRGLGDQAGRISVRGVTTGLDAALADSDRSLTVTRANVIAVLIQVSLLAGFAIALTAELVVSSRSEETVLSHARGAGRRPIVLAAAVEATLIVAPLALAAPWVASQALGLLERVGPVASIDLDLDLAPTSDAWIAVAGAAVAAVGFLVWPTARVAATNLEEGRRNRRSTSRARFQRAGVDVALVVVAAIAIWQLRGLGSRRTEQADGTFGIDPLLIVSPAVATLAGGILTLRFIPAVARVGEVVAARRRSAVLALTAWQVARRPRRHTRAALLLVLAVAIGFFAATYAATWRASQGDQAQHRVGADARALPDRRTGEAMPDINLVAATTQVDGIASVIGVERRPTGLPGSEQPAELLLVDAAGDPTATFARTDPAEAADLMAALAASRPDPPGIPISGVFDAIAVTVQVDQAELEIELEGTDEDVEPARFDGLLDLVVVDGRGALHRLTGPALEPDGEPARIVYELGAGGIDAPLTVMDFEIRSITPTLPTAVARLSVTGLESRSDGDWRRVDFDPSNAAWLLARTTSPTLFEQPQITHVDAEPAGTLSLDLTLGIAGRPQLVTYAVRASGPRAPETVPIVVSDDWLAESGTEVGDTFSLDGLRAGDDRVTVVGAVPYIPTIDPALTTGVLVDRSTAQFAAHEPGRQVTDLSELWMRLDADADPEAVAAALRAEPFLVVDVLTADGLEDALTTDAIALGTAGALAVGFAAAAVVTAIGFAVSAAVSARERATEFALLRALGLSSRQLARWLATEQTLTVAISLTLGTAVGWLLSTAVLPLTSLTQQGDPVVPEVEVVYPWRSILAIDLLLIGVLVVVVVTMSVALRRVGLGERLRSGDDR